MRSSSLRRLGVARACRQITSTPLQMLAALLAGALALCGCGGNASLSSQTSATTRSSGASHSEATATTASSSIANVKLHLDEGSRSVESVTAIVRGTVTRGAKVTVNGQSAHVRAKQKKLLKPPKKPEGFPREREVVLLVAASDRLFVADFRRLIVKRPLRALAALLSGCQSCKRGCAIIAPVIATPHMLAGAAAASRVRTPGAALVAGSLVHLLLDAVPHRDYDVSALRGAVLAADITAGTFAVCAMPGCSRMRLAGALGGLLPDLLRRVQRHGPLRSTGWVHGTVHTSRHPSARVSAATQILVAVSSALMLVDARSQIVKRHSASSALGCQVTGQASPFT